MDGTNITYDLIHVCKKRDPAATCDPRSWAGIRQEIRRRAREEIAAIEAGRYGNEPLSPLDVNIVLIGKCLELYSRHYGAVVDHEGKDVPLHEALKQIRDIADQMTERERPLPSELEDIDPESRVYLRALCAAREIKVDDVSKATRGVLEPSELLDAGLMKKGRAGRGRTYEVKQPGERLTELMERFRDGATSPQVDLFGEVERPKEKRGTLFIDRVHLLLGLAEAGENIVPWLDRFRGDTPQVRAALEYLEARNRGLAPACRKVLDMLEIGPLFKRGGVMPGYHLIEQGTPIPEDEGRPPEKIGFLDFLRELSGEEPSIPRFWSVAVEGLEEVLFASDAEADSLATEIYNRLRAAGGLLERRLANVYVVFRGQLGRGEDLWSNYRGARLPIGRIFGAPPPQTGPGGQRTFFANFNLTHGG
jgi:hypothetical protein